VSGPEPGLTPIGAAVGLARVRRAGELLGEHQATLRRTARRYSADAEDAEDAFQRAAEILVAKGPELEPPALLAWMQVVTRREAFAVARARGRSQRETGNRSLPTAGEGPALEAIPSPGPGPEQHLERREQVGAAARALARLKPQERRAIALQAAGCSYAEIQAITGWTYTKVNRCLAEGRARLRLLDSPAIA
jgi:RNA polymerase sigma factor (sigma-70 family)